MREPKTIERRSGDCSVGGSAVCLRWPLLCLVITSSVLAFEDQALARPEADAKPPDVTVLTEEDQVRSDLKRLIGRWVRTVPGEQELREVLTIDGEHDTLDVVNRDGAVICRSTSRFRLERVGDVRIYNRTDVKLVKGQALFRPGTETQSFIVQIARRGFFEVSGMLYHRNASLPVQSAIFWNEIGAPERVAENDAEGDEERARALRAMDEPAEPADTDPPKFNDPDRIGDAKQSNAEPPEFNDAEEIGGAMQSKFEPPAGMADDPDVKRDLAMIQGAWVLTSRDADGRVIATSEKLIEGNTERLIQSTADGKVSYEHTVKFRLEKYGPVRIFYFYDLTIVVGPNAGAVQPKGSAFVYKVDGDTFLDCGGTFVSRESYRSDPAVVVWRRPPTAQVLNAELKIEELGGVISRNMRGNGEAIGIRLIGNKFGDEQLALLKSFKNLTELALIDSQVTDAGMKEVARLADLTRLDVKGTPITDAGLKELARSEKLKSLGLERTRTRGPRYPVSDLVRAPRVLRESRVPCRLQQMLSVTTICSIGQLGAAMGEQNKYANG